MTSFTVKRALGAVVTAGAVVAIPLAMGTGTASAAGHDWSGVANCESSGNWAANTGNGFYGGLQFTQSTWNAYGGAGNAADASQAEQIRVAENVLAGQGVGAWPVCGQYLTSGTTEVSDEVAAAPVIAESNYEAVAAPVTAEAAVESAPAAHSEDLSAIVRESLSKIAAAQGISIESLLSQISALLPWLSQSA